MANTILSEGLRELGFSAKATCLDRPEALVFQPYAALF
jgi:hypothetical protein